MKATPRIYIACLASYNTGILHGRWIELDGTEDLEERLLEIRESSTEAETTEWAVHDHEYCGPLGEHPGLQRLEVLQETFRKTEAEGVNWELFATFCDYAGHDLEPGSVARFHDSFAGTGYSLVDWCHHFLEDTGEIGRIPEHLRDYFDFSAYARDLEINDVFTVEHDGETHVFWANERSAPRPSTRCFIHLECRGSGPGVPKDNHPI